MKFIEDKKPIIATSDDPLDKSPAFDLYFEQKPTGEMKPIPKPKKAPAPTIPLGDIRQVCLKYMGSKKRWKKPGCDEPDFKLVKGVLDWLDLQKA